jgi:hypothetical protein
MRSRGPSIGSAQPAIAETDTISASAGRDNLQLPWRMMVAKTRRIES